ncbi:phosphate ABC transporter permease PstA [Leptospira wolffii]|uniref:Phosphate transport system permease protein PstA n=1 Tax=Leptospira wolffii TaxID=409998 RepID=A0A2M9ZAV7_9LEPT|nr:phosphate ABC transporter permease PstA [Leptospira wolffii]PJZ65549.1 phosphate ABC transporter, permease protein PstA [Leptospira wolffii]TGK56235.1 phosphate ABC transporter permease PstA [Leptospira wolffii]TGK72282.1 phosphate ABC transporter permease PstA [Leptospira wolffii]TGK72812.1 phosphate ABC transporter permease PstA [Leptospira wolffii]TGL27859.1 phosphate ABC transporter permease PstA [Leptospira wolffii]
MKWKKVKLKRKRVIKDRLFSILAVGLPMLATGIILFAVLFMLGNILYKGLSGVSWEFLTEAPRNNNLEGGIFPAIYGTVYLVFIMILFSIPIGTATGIFLSEYTSRDSRFTMTVRFAINTLAGVPSIVFGLFGVGFFIQFIGKGIDFAAGNTSAVWGKPALIWAAATLAILTLPVVIISVEETMRSIPREMRESSLALGATKWQTIWKLVLPNSVTGILTGAILAIGRGAGEVAPILFVGVVYSLPELPTHLSDQFMQLGYHLFVLSTQSPDVDAAMPKQYATTVVLLVLTFGMSFFATYLRYKIRKARGRAHV